MFSKKNNYPANRIYSVDVTGLSVVQNKISYVVGLKGKKLIGFLTSSEKVPL